MNKYIHNFLGHFLNDSDEILSEKNRIRHYIKDLKGAYSELQKQESANEVFAKIESMPEFIASNTILIYWSTASELPTQEFISKWKEQKQILLPIVVGEQMEIKKFSSVEKMEKGYLGIWEPFSEESVCHEPDLIIVPGVAFDKMKNRLGRGKGYYDRYFNQSKAQKWGIGFDFQLIESVPTNINDVPLDKIITPSNCIE